MKPLEVCLRRNNSCGFDEVSANVVRGLYDKIAKLEFYIFQQTFFIYKAFNFHYFFSMFSYFFII